MKQATFILSGLGLVVACIAFLLLSNRRTPPASAPIAKANPLPAAQAERAASAEPAAVPTPSTEPTAQSELAPAPPAEPQVVNFPKTNNAPAPGRSTAKRPSAKSDPPAKDELARLALSFVGVDPAAEAYWMEAINDPSLGPEERQNLIEDLNEDGLSDPKRPSPMDLPLILSRIELIEELAPGAMDKANADAFQEAYKDLVNLAALAMGGGESVR